MANVSSEFSLSTYSNGTYEPTSRLCPNVNIKNQRPTTSAGKSDCGRSGSQLVEFCDVTEHYATMCPEDRTSHHTPVACDVSSPECYHGAGYMHRHDVEGNSTGNRGRNATRLSPQMNKNESESERLDSDVETDAIMSSAPFVDAISTTTSSFQSFQESSPTANRSLSHQNALLLSGYRGSSDNSSKSINGNNAIAFRPFLIPNNTPYEQNNTHRPSGPQPAEDVRPVEREVLGREQQCTEEPRYHRTGSTTSGPFPSAFQDQRQWHAKATASRRVMIPSSSVSSERTSDRDRRSSLETERDRRPQTGLQLTRTEELPLQAGRLVQNVDEVLAENVTLRDANKRQADIICSLRKDIETMNRQLHGSDSAAAAADDGGFQVVRSTPQNEELLIKIALLHAQVKTYEDDFANERRDKERAVAEKRSLFQQTTDLLGQLRRLSEKNEELKRALEAARSRRNID